MFLDVWILAVAGLIFITEGYNESNNIPTTEEVIRKIHYEDMLIDHSSEIIDRLHWYSDIFTKPLCDFTEQDISKVDGLKEFAKNELIDFINILPDVVRKQKNSIGK